MHSGCGGPDGTLAFFLFCFFLFVFLHFEFVALLDGLLYFGLRHLHFMHFAYYANYD